MRKLWTFGDSYTAEYEYHHNDTYTKYKEIKGYEIKTWPKVLSEKLGMFLENKGKRGSSNYDIFECFIQNFGNISENDFVIIGWGLLSKFRFAEDGRFITIHPDTQVDFFKTIIKNRENEVWQSEIHNWMKLITNICHLKNVKHYFWSSEDPKLFYSQDSKSRYGCDKNKKILCNEANTGLVFDLISKGIETIEKDTQGLISDCHLGKNGHVYLADLFYNQIKENNFQ